MACLFGFLAGREAARLMLPWGKGNIFFTGATASLRGGSGYAAFASAKFARGCAINGARTRARIAEVHSHKLVREVIEWHVSAEATQALCVAEESERELLRMWRPR